MFNVTFNIEMLVYKIVNSRYAVIIVGIWTVTQFSYDITLHLADALIQSDVQRSA